MGKKAVKRASDCQIEVNSKATGIFAVAVDIPCLEGKRENYHVCMYVGLCM